MMRDPDGQLGFRCFPRPGAEVLLLCFAGVAGQLGIPEFEFEKATVDLPASRILLRDPHKRFYLKGVRGLGGSVTRTVRRLRDLARDEGARRIVCIGNSMGGFGAILYGALLDADRTMAFKARSTVKWNHLLELGDRRKFRRMLLLNLTSGLGRRFRDLRKVLQTTAHRNGRVDIYFPSGDSIYTTYARRLEGLPGVSLHEESPLQRGHNLIKAMRDSGRLHELLWESIAADSYSGRGFRC